MSWGALPDGRTDGRVCYVGVTVRVCEYVHVSILQVRGRNHFHVSMISNNEKCYTRVYNDSKAVTIKELDTDPRLPRSRFPYL
jgi:polyribonucleotide nucleotidyltransferase